LQEMVKQKKSVHALDGMALRLGYKQVNPEFQEKQRVGGKQRARELKGQEMPKRRLDMRERQLLERTLARRGTLSGSGRRKSGRAFMHLGKGALTRIGRGQPNRWRNLLNMGQLAKCKKVEAAQAGFQTGEKKRTRSDQGYDKKKASYRHG